MDNIWIEEYCYAAIEWYDGNFTNENGVDYRFNLCNDDGNLMLEWIDNIPEDHIVKEKEIFDKFNKRYN